MNAEQIANVLAADATTKQAEAKAALFKLPVLRFPEDYGILTGQGRSAAYDMAAKDSDFPPLIKIGKQSFVRTELVLEWMIAKEAK